jgi:hypothetical protein
MTPVIFLPCQQNYRAKQVMSNLKISFRITFYFYLKFEYSTIKKYSIKSMKSRIGLYGLLTFPFFSFLYQGALSGQSKAIESAEDVLLFTLPATAIGANIFEESRQGTW